MGINILVAGFVIALFVLVLALMLPSFGQHGISRRKMRNRIAAMAMNSSSEVLQLMRKQKLENLGSTAQFLEEWAVTSPVRRLLEHAGTQRAVVTVLLHSFFAGALVGVICYSIFSHGGATFVAFCIGIWIPIVQLILQKNRRLALFEEHLPDAIDVIKRAVQAGYPFVEALKVVADELEGPVAQEFGITFMDVNFGSPLQGALSAMLERVPSTTLLALVTSLLVQKESGGNLTEILERINHVIRGRTRFQRRVKTLSAEGRISAWMLTMLPFVLIIILQLTSPSYLKPLYEHPDGFQIIGYALGGMLLGVLCMRKIIRVRV